MILTYGACVNVMFWMYKMENNDAHDRSSAQRSYPPPPLLSALVNSPIIVIISWSIQDSILGRGGIGGVVPEKKKHTKYHHLHHHPLGEPLEGFSILPYMRFLCLFFPMKSLEPRGSWQTWTISSQLCLSDRSAKEKKRKKIRGHTVSPSY